MDQFKLRIETSINDSGKLNKIGKITVLKDSHYYIKDIALGGDAPKQFIYVYEFSRGGHVRKNSKKSWIPYIAKTAEKWYPHESVIEYAINRIGFVLGLNMNEIRLMQINTQIRFLSKYFLTYGEEELVHGADICGEYTGNYDEAREIANDKKKAREIFTFEYIKDAIRNVFPNEFEELMLQFVKMLVFDAVVGNNDRHFYNWGVIRSVTNQDNNVIFAPLYDSARGLLWNFNEDNIKNLLLHYGRDGGKKLSNYLKNSCPRISIEDDKEINHFELVRFIANYNPEYKEIVQDLVNSDCEEKVLDLLEKEIFLFFSEHRKRIIRIVIKERFKQLRDRLC